MTNFKPTNDWHIKINGHEHGIPHVHVEFRDGSRVVVSIKTREVLAGKVTPPSRIAPALENIKANENVYLNEFMRLNP